MRKILSMILCAVMLMGLLAGCSGDRRKPNMDVTIPLNDQPILPTMNQTEGAVHTPVYATVFEGTVLLATVPVQKWEGFEEPECPTREISKGGQILCGGEHEQEFPITKVLIVETLAPDSTSEWFSGMTKLVQIAGVEELETRYVTDMTDMFRDCHLLTDLPEWYAENEDAA